MGHPRSSGLAHVQGWKGKAIAGTGTVAVTGLQTDLDADLSTITATTVTATIDTNNGVAYLGDLGTAAVTLISSSADAAKVAVTNGAGAYTVTLGANTTVYVIDTDGTDLDGASTDTAIADFSSMEAVAAFLNAGGAGAVTTSDTAGKIDYFIINDETDADAAYVYKLTDDGNGTTTVEDTELSLIATIAMSADGDLSTAEVLIA